MDEKREGKDREYAELVGEKLRRMRQERGLSLQEVCARSGGSFVVSTLSAYERGKRSLSLERLSELAAIYGQSPMSVWTSMATRVSAVRPPEALRSASAWTTWTISRPRSAGRWSRTSPSCASSATTPPVRC